MDNTFSLPKIPGYEMEITDDQTKLTGDTLAIDFETFYEGGLLHDLHGCPVLLHPRKV